MFDTAFRLVGEVQKRAGGKPVLVAIYDRDGGAICLIRHGGVPANMVAQAQDGADFVLARRSDGIHYARTFAGTVLLYSATGAVVGVLVVIIEGTSAEGLHFIATDTAGQAGLRLETRVLKQIAA